MKHPLQPFREDRGQILLLTAFSMVALIGMAAFALDISHSYDVRNKLAMTADAAAKAGAHEIWRGNSTNYAVFTQKVIDLDKTAGRIPSTTTAIIRLCSDAGATCLPAFSTNKYVEVILNETHATFLAGVIGISSMAPQARAVAGTSHGTSCLLTLDGGMVQTNPATGAVVTADGCDVAITGDFEVYGTLNADSITAGSCSAGCGAVTIGPPPDDPLASLPTPSAGDCGTNFGDITVPGSMPLVPGTYHNIKFLTSFGSTDWLTLSSGIYCITGLLEAANHGVDLSIDGTSGVLIYIAPSGEFRADGNNISLKLWAMASGPWEGVSFFQDRTNPNPVTFGWNNGYVDTNGAIYVPAATVVAKNANFASSRQCGILVAGAIAWDKPNLTFANECNDFTNGSPLKSVALAE